MNHPAGRKTTASSRSIPGPGDRTEIVPMHPDDFEALLAWITAKRLHEMVQKESFPKKPGYCRSTG